VVAGLEHTLGLVQFSIGELPRGPLLAAGAFYIFFLMLAAANEELVFRGYAFQRLADSLRPMGAVAVFSVLFALGHLANPSHTLISTVNTVLIGVLLAVAYLRTRALWLPLGVHFAWNYVQGFVLGYPVSGLEMPRGMVSAHVHGAAQLTGGQYGPEGSLLTTLVILAALVYVSFSRRLRATRTMQLLSAPSAAWRAESERNDIFPESASDPEKV
jgi:hypothetical protein